MVELFVLCLIGAWTCLCVIFEYGMILGEDACVEQRRNPGLLAQATRLSENTRGSPLPLHEISPRRAGVA